MKIYTAALFSEQARMRRINDELIQIGHNPTARWINATATDDQAAAAVECFEDVMEADAVIKFSLPRGTYYKGGGRQTEWGLAITLNKRLILVGDREQVFDHFPGIDQFDTWEQARPFLRNQA